MRLQRWYHQHDDDAGRVTTRLPSLRYQSRDLHRVPMRLPMMRSASGPGRVRQRVGLREFADPQCCPGEAERIHWIAVGSDVMNGTLLVALGMPSLLPKLSLSMRYGFGAARRS